MLKYDSWIHIKLSKSGPYFEVRDTHEMLKSNTSSRAKAKFRLQIDE